MDKDEPASIGRIAFEKPVEESQSFRYAFGVVEAIDADPEEFPVERKLFAPALHLRGDRNGLGCVAVLVEVDTDRERANGGRMSSAANLRSRLIDTSFHRAIDSLQEVLAMMLKMEPQQVIPQQTVQKLFPPRERVEYFAIWPWNVPELSNHKVRARVAKHARKQAEVVILNKDEGRFVLRFFQNCFGKALIHTPIGLPIFGSEQRTSECNVTQRPQAFV